MTATLMQADRSLLVLVDFQSRLTPHVADGAAVVANANRLIGAAKLLNLPAIVTEQNAEGLGATVAELDVARLPIIAKQTFGSCATPGFIAAIGTHPDVILAGCEAHVCVLQTVLGLLALGRRVYVVRDATGARTPESKETALARMARHGAEIVTTEMVIFEWVRSSTHAGFRQAVALVKG